MVSIRILPVPFVLTMVFLLHLNYFGYISLYRRKIEMTRDSQVWMGKQGEYAGQRRSLHYSSEEENENADYGRENRQLTMFKEIEQWYFKCSSDDTLLPLPSELFLLHKREDVWGELENRALIITSNFPWRSTIGLLQRLYQPFFKVFVRSLIDTDLEGFPEITTPFIYINLTEQDIYQGYLVYICLVRARELLLSEVEGFFMMSDDAMYNFWHTLELRKVLHPTGITWQGYTGMWWPSPYGSQAVEHALILITDKYRNDWSTQNMWKKYQDGLIANGFIGTAHRQLTQVDGWCLSDFFYIPSSEMKYFSDLMIILHEAKVFHEIAISKYLYTVPHNRLDASRYKYLWEDRDKWAELYSEDLVLLHPIKFSQFTNLETRAREPSTPYHWYSNLPIAPKPPMVLQFICTSVPLTIRNKKQARKSMQMLIEGILRAAPTPETDFEVNVVYDPRMLESSSLKPIYERKRIYVEWEDGIGIRGHILKLHRRVYSVLGSS